MSNQRQPRKSYADLALQFWMISGLVREEGQAVYADDVAEAAAKVGPTCPPMLAKRYEELYAFVQVQYGARTPVLVKR